MKVQTLTKAKNLESSDSIRYTELRILQDPSIKPGHTAWRPFPTRTDSSQAQRLLSAYTLIKPQQPKAQLGARARLETAFAQADAGINPDLVFEIFNDLDKVLFGSTLRSRVLVEWKDRSHFSKKQVAKVYVKKGCRIRPHIILSTRLFSYPKAFVWGTLVHEMLHAYSAIMTRLEDTSSNSEVNRKTREEAHGPMFREACELLASKLKLPGLDAKAIL